MHQQYRTFVEQFHGTNANINNMFFWTGKVFMVEVALLVLLSSSATAQWDPATGHVKPSATSGPPFFDPAPWNGGYKVTFRSVPISRSTAGIPEWPYAPVRGVDTTQECSTDGFDTTPASTVDMGACFYKNNTDGTFDFWRKERTLAFSRANCYCYALNRFEGDTCQPGLSNGERGRKRYVDKMTCPAVHQSVVDDGAVPVSRSEALTGQPEQGHYIVMLARAPGCAGDDCDDEDFHAMRKDADGTWSWKLPNVPASNKDLEGRPITDPETAPLPGHYTVCGYYRVEPAKMFVGTSDPRPGPLADMSAVQSYRSNPSVKVTITPAPYNPELDGTPPIRVQSILAQHAAWERKRGTQAYKDWKRKQLVALEVGAAAAPSAGGSSSTAAPATTADGTNTGSPSAEGANAGKGGVPLAATAGRRLKSLILT